MAPPFRDLWRTCLENCGVVVNLKWLILYAKRSLLKAALANVAGVGSAAASNGTDTWGEFGGRIRSERRATNIMNQPGAR
jgi:hypothetical protein